MTKIKRSRAGVLPGESRKRSLVTITKDSLGKEADAYGREAHNYIVATRYMDGTWSYEVEYRGQTWMLPGRVVERMQAHREAIIREQRSLKAQETHLKLVEKAQKQEQA